MPKVTADRVSRGLSVRVFPTISPFHYGHHLDPSASNLALELVIYVLKLFCTFCRIMKWRPR
jgi:hypothetical protein